MKSITTVLAMVALLSACDTMVPRDIDTSRLAYVTLDTQGEPSKMCFDTISPNNCISGNQDSLLKRFNPKHRIMLQQYILVVQQPVQIDCKINHPHECRLYFEHIYVDIQINTEEMNKLRQQLDKINI